MPDAAPLPTEPQDEQATAEARGELRRQWDQVSSKIDKLVAERDELAEHLTEDHPQVVDLNEQLDLLQQELAAIGDRPQVESLPPGNPSLGEAHHGEPPTAAHVDKQAHLSAVDQYDDLVLRWQFAEHNLQLAVAAERLAEQRVAALAMQDEPPSEPQQAQPAPPLARVVEVRPAAASQPLALAALLIALAVAALAAVRLARSESTFANVDEVAAALALPVVGVIPATLDGHAKANSSLIRGLRFAGELTIAFLAFATLAYGVQHAEALWQLLTHPFDWLR